MSNHSFFVEHKESSKVKSQIVVKYFSAWATIMKVKKLSKNIAYIDLFSGPGRYEDGTKSTPLLILEQAIANPDIGEILITIFNDIKSNYTKTLQKEIHALSNINTLIHQPIFLNFEVNNKIIFEVNNKIIEQINQIKEIKRVPKLFFIDPWGYKGLSLELIRSAISDWGCDLIFFFNYNRINMGLHNEIVDTLIDSFFGGERAESLREQIKYKRPDERESIILEAVRQSLEEVGGKYHLDFGFKNAKDTRTSHYIIFVSKNKTGYSIMKDIMAKSSSTSEQGVASFEYSQTQSKEKQLTLEFFIDKPLDRLGEMLLDEFAGQTLTRKEIYEQHHPGKRYTNKNYREILLQLEAEGKVTMSPPAHKRRKNTLSETGVQITFPPKQAS